ncbi:MAG TPA: FecR family protein [Planctomycetota bacterium]|nr:FecR family protein [Planctomycetota bacterium]
MFARTLLTAAACCLFAGILSARAGEPAPAGDPKDAKGTAESLAVASRVSGTVEFCRQGATAFAALAQDGTLSKGDTVRTGKRSAVELKLADKSCLTLGEESSLVLRDVRGQAGSDRTLLDLDEGQLGAAVEKLGERQRFEISTPVAVCGVRGTRFAIGHANPPGGPKGNDRGKTLLTVGFGKVNGDCRNPLFGGKGGVDVDKGKRVIITWDGIGKLEDVGIGNFKGLMKTLPGWHPDPADPNMAKLDVGWPGPLAGRPGGGLFDRGGKEGAGAYDRGGRGFSNGVGGAILGSLGLADSGRGRGGQGGANGAGGGNPTGALDTVFGSAVGGTDPVLPGLVRPGQETEPPFEPN